MAVSTNKYLLKMAAMIKRSKKPPVYTSIAGKITPVESPKSKNLFQRKQEEGDERPTGDEDPDGGISYE
jgi:hypothetical protein